MNVYTMLAGEIAARQTSRVSIVTAPVTVQPQVNVVSRAGNLFTGGSTQTPTVPNVATGGPAAPVEGSAPFGGYNPYDYPAGYKGGLSTYTSKEPNALPALSTANADAVGDFPQPTSMTVPYGILAVGAVLAYILFFK